MNRPELIDRLSTVVGIPVVPYDSAGEVDHVRTGELTDRLVAGGVEVLTPNGNTGEFYALSPDERRAVATTVIEAVAGRATVVAGVGLDLASAVADARFAREAGADAVMVHQPVLPYLSPAGWLAYNTAVAAAVPELGVVPYLSTTLVTGADIARLLADCPNVVAVKYSVPDPVHFATVRAEADVDLVWIAGLAESYAPAYWQAGARGFTSGLVNVAPDVSLALLAALRAGDSGAAQTVWGQIRAFEHLRARNSSADNVSVVKEAMQQLGLCGREVRPPSSVLGPEAREEVAGALAAFAPVRVAG